MGLCETINNSSSLIRIDDKIKNISTEYLIDNSIHENIKNHYKLNSKIGQGSFGKVFLAEDNSGEKYAVKCFKKKKFTSDNFSINEIKIGLKVKHPNILGIKEIYEDMKSIYLVMEYCNGGNLLDYIVKAPSGKLDDITTVNIIIQILDAVNYLHNIIKICHRDIKLENCLISYKEENKPIIKLIDFGTAQYIEKNKKFKGKIGTLKYMAPEIFVRPFYDEKVDLWSVGIILYNMATGRDAFELKIKKNTNVDILNKEIIFDLIENEDIRNLCKELLERNPNKRIEAKVALKKAKIIKQKLFMNFNEYYYYK